MKSPDVTDVRIYIGEGAMTRFRVKRHDDEKARGAAVFHGVAGKSGAVQPARRLDPPLVVECFDAPRKVDAILNHREDMVPLGHAMTRPAGMNGA